MKYDDLIRESDLREYAIRHTNPYDWYRVEKGNKERHRCCPLIRQSRSTTDLWAVEMFPAVGWDHVPTDFRRILQAGRAVWYKHFASLPGMSRNDTCGSNFFSSGLTFEAATETFDLMVAAAKGVLLAAVERTIFRSIDDRRILEFLAALGDETGTIFPHQVTSIRLAMASTNFAAADIPEKIALAKMQDLLDDKLVDGCACGCRGDFELTQKGRDFINAQANA